MSRAEDLDDALRVLPDELHGRVRHVVTEDARVLDAVTALRVGDWSRLGTLMDASHESLRVDYEVSCEELDVAVAAARAAGALGARMTGGGFGGSAIALVPVAERGLGGRGGHRRLCRPWLGRPGRRRGHALAGRPSGRLIGQLTGGPFVRKAADLV